jgi:hypothetical protein
VDEFIGKIFFIPTQSQPGTQTFSTRISVSSKLRSSNRNVGQMTTHNYVAIETKNSGIFIGDEIANEQAQGQCDRSTGAAGSPILCSLTYRQSQLWSAIPSFS